MFDTFLAVPLHFTIEFVGFLVASAAAFLVASRPSLITGTGSNRGAATLGFGALAVAQVAHGGSFLESDADEVLIALKTFGLALILIGVVGGVRQPGAAALITAGEPAAFSPALAAAAIALMSFVGSFRGSRELRRLALGTLLLAIGEAAVALSPPGDQVRLEGTNELIPHCLRLLGYLAVASWLWTGVRSSIRTRFVASFVTLLVVVVLALSTALTGVISSNIEAGELDRVTRQMRNVLDAIGRTERADIAQDARLAADINDVQAAVAAGDDANPIATQIIESELFDADAVVLMNAKGKLLGSAGHGGFVTETKTRRLKNEDLLRLLGLPPVQNMIKDPTIPDAADMGRVGDSVALVGVSKVFELGGDKVAGVLALANFLDHLTVTNVSKNVAVDTSIRVGNRIVATRLPKVVAASQLVPKDAREELTTDFEDGVVARTQELGGETYYSAIAELRREDGFAVGHIVLSSAAARVANPARENVTSTLFLVALGAGTVVLVLAYYSGRRITRPIQALTETAQRVREGDLKAQTEVAGEDEVGQLGETFNEMTTSLFRMTNDLRDAAREEFQLRARIETIIEAMADGLVAVDASGKIQLLNREAESMTGVEAAQAMGSPIEDILVARDPQGEVVNLPIYDLAEGSVAAIYIDRRDDDPVPATIVCAVLRTEEETTVGGVAVVRDMSREREVERMKSEFLSNISHELRTPLTPIKGYAEILNRKETTADKTQQFSKGILESTHRLERIVELLVDFAALEAGRLSPRAASVDLAGMVARLAEEWEGRSTQHRVVADVGAKLPKVIGDERLLRRSLEEILDNAMKFSPQGGTITLKVSGAVRGNGHERRRATRAVEVTISDEGIGIPPEDISKIFSDFQQLDGSETRSYGGLGLGLAFVRRIVEAHDGTVRVQSEPQRGTRLTVSIPAASPGRTGEARAGD